MKKLIAIILTILLTISVFSACSHEHTYTWAVSDEGHYKVFTCGCETIETYSYHVDTNGDKICDYCSYELPKSNVKPNNPDSSTNSGADSDNSGDNGSNNGNQNQTSYTYTAFTPTEKALFIQYIGEVIPFVPNNEYYVEGYYDKTGYEYGMSFYTFGNTQADFDAYLLKFADYELYGTYEDTAGDTWYCYVKGDIVVDLAFYYHEGDYVIDLYVYSTTLSLDPDDDPSSGSSSGSGSGSGSGSDSSDSDITLITNDGKGLPTSSNGVYNVDFTRAKNVKNVTDQGYYLGGCPTTGSPAVLVIPVEFSDCTARSKGYTTEKIANAFEKNGNCDYYSVYDYYYISSYGNLTLDITVLDFWFKPSKTSSYYESATTNYYGSTISIGDQMIMDEALNYLSNTKNMDLSKFDSDNNGMIDSIVLINTLNVGDDDFHWAYRYWNIYTDSNDYYYEYDGVSANDYVWASYQFLQESYNSNGDAIYTDTSITNPYTFIHEFAHVLGVDDYYDTAYVSHPLDGCDIMDSMTGDHNAFTKFNLGWITTSRLVVTNSQVTLTLESFSKNGDTIILANDWDESLGAYQEYYVIVYYTTDGLNGDDYGYFARSGIVVYHINASLYKEVYDGTTYYDVYNNNTDVSDQYGTENNLIEFVKSSAGNFTYVAGDKLSTNVKDDSGESLGYTFTINSLTSTTATITFTKIN